jgi:hypothetical protein
MSTEVPNLLDLGAVNDFVTMYRARKHQIYAYFICQTTRMCVVIMSILTQPIDQVFLFCLG